MYSSQIVLRVPISELHEIHTSPTVDIDDYDFHFKLKPSLNHPGRHDLIVYIIEGNFPINVKLDYTPICNPGRPWTLFHKYKKAEGYGWSQLIKMSDLQNSPYVENGHISIKINITLLLE
jgi:hypothetical protein